MNRAWLAAFLLPIILVFYMQLAYAVWLRPSRAIVVCEPGAVKQFSILVGGGSGRVSVSLKPVTNLEGITVSHVIKPLGKGVENVTIIVSCHEPGLYTYRVEVASLRKSNAPIAAIESAAGILTVVVKGVRAFIVNPSFKGDILRFTVLVESYGIKPDKIVARIYVGNNSVKTITLTKPFASINVAERVGLAETVKILVSLKAYVNNTIMYSYLAEKVLKRLVKVVANLSLELRGPQLLIPLKSVEAYQVYTSLNGNATCNIEYSFTAGSSVQIWRDVLEPGSRKIKTIYINVNPLSLIPTMHTLRLTASYACGPLHKTASEELTVVVIPPLLILVLALAITTLYIYLHRRKQRV